MRISNPVSPANPKASTKAVVSRLRVPSLLVESPMEAAELYWEVDASPAGVPPRALRMVASRERAVESPARGPPLAESVL